MKKLIKFILCSILILIIIITESSFILNYNVTPSLVYKILPENIITDGGFENFNQTSGDCCNRDETASKVFATKSLEAFKGKYSLNLTSKNQCACIAEHVNDVDYDIYLLSFYYKGQNPRYCVWANPGDLCLSEGHLNISNNWMIHQEILNYDHKYKNSNVVLYADSDGSQIISNFYDDLQMNRLIKISSNVPFSEDSRYIVLTKKVNKVNGIFLSNAEDDEAYYVVDGVPDITLRFPWNDFFLILLIMIIIVRLIFKKEENDKEESIKPKKKNRK